MSLILVWTETGPCAVSSQNTALHRVSGIWQRLVGLNILIRLREATRGLIYVLSHDEASELFHDLSRDLSFTPDSMVESGASAGRDVTVGGAGVEGWRGGGVGGGAAAVLTFRSPAAAASRPRRERL